MRIAFAGQSRSGKDTAIDYLMTLADRPVKLHIADSVYSTARFITNEQVIDNTDPRMRKLLQDIGTAGRNFSEDFWLKKLEDEIYKVEYQRFENIFITGIRYPNEVARLRELGFRVIYLTRDLDVRVSAGASNLAHHSETSLSTNDFNHADILSNNGTLEEFKAALLARLQNDQVRVQTSPT